MANVGNEEAEATYLYIVTLQTCLNTWQRCIRTVAQWKRRNDLNCFLRLPIANLN